MAGLCTGGWFLGYFHQESHVSSVENPGWLFDIGDYTTQLYGDYNKPIYGSLLTNRVLNVAHVTNSIQIWTLQVVKTSHS